MGIKIKNLQTGEFEKFNIPALKGEKGEPGEIEPSEKVDYIGKQHSKLRDTMNANVDYIIKTAIGEFNYLDYEGQHITATNSIEGHARSAILKGQTLVNLVKPHKALETYYKPGISTSYQQKDISLIRPLEPSKTYTIQMNITRTNGNMAFHSIVIGKGSSNGDKWGYRLYTGDFTNQAKELGITKCLFTTPSYVSETNFSYIKFISERYDIDATIEDIMIIEGDYTNVDIPYFTGMQSVKMPVLKTVGSNVFDEDNSMELGAWSSNSNPVEVSNEIRCKNKHIPFPNGLKNGDVMRIVLSDTSINSNTNMHVYDESKTRITTLGYETNPYIEGTNFINGVSTITIHDVSKCKYFSFRAVSTNTECKFAIMVNTSAPYEPYKSNILTVNEEVILRGIGDVKDTLDISTEEKVERIGEVVYTGDEDWKTTTMNQIPDNIGFYLPLNNHLNDTNNSTMRELVKDNLGFTNNCFSATINTPELNGKKGFSIHNNGNVYFTIPTSECASISAWKNKLKEQPLVLQYAINPVVKTVDLSDNHVYSYDNTTHYDCSSAEGYLVPTLSVKVPTDTQLTIQEQKATTQTLLIKNMDLQQSIKEVQAMNLAFNTALYNSFNSIREEVEDIKKHVSTNENLEGSF